jgi:hypothetical protein
MTSDSSSASRRKRLNTLNNLAKSLKDSKELIKKDAEEDEDNILKTMDKAIHMKKFKKKDEE